MDYKSFSLIKNINLSTTVFYSVFTAIMAVKTIWFLLWGTRIGQLSGKLLDLPEYEEDSLTGGYEALLYPYVDSKGNFGKFYSRDMAYAASRYTEAKLIHEMEELGIGRPSTYATIMANIKDRGYVTIEDKKFKPTDIGIQVTDKLQESFLFLYFL